MCVVPGATSSGTSDVSAAFALEAGALCVVAVRFLSPSDGISITSVTDTAGNTYAKAAHHYHTTSQDRLELWYAMNTTAHASNVVTAVYSSAASFRTINVAQYQGIAVSSALDATATGESSGTNTITSGTFSTAQDDELIVCAVQAAATGNLWAGIGYATRVQDGSQIAALLDQPVYATLTSASVAISCPSTASKSIVVATFKAAAATGGETVAVIG